MANSQNYQEKEKFNLNLEDINKGVKTWANENGTQVNILKGVGIAAGIGVLAWAAYRFIPFERLFNNIEEAYDENFGEGKESRELINVEE